MKRLLAFLFTSVACYAGDMIRTTESDFKKPAQWYADELAPFRSKLDLAKDDDRKALNRFEQEMYVDAMMEVSDQFFRCTTLKKGDDWKKLLVDRKYAALEEVAVDKTERESLAKAIVKLKDFENEGTAMILERVVKAKFGGETTWIFLVHWEIDEAVTRQIASGKETRLGHFLVIAVRASDQKIVSRAMCG